MYLVRAIQRVSLLSPTTLAAAVPAVRGFSTPNRPNLDSTSSSTIPKETWHPVDMATRTASQNVLNVVIKTGGKAQTHEELWKQMSEEAKDELERYPPHDPYFGRSVKVVDGNIQEAFRRLSTILSRNKVAKQLRMAERHEKKGVKRRRLESERWRRLFAHEVRKNVQLVTKIRNRGA
ncbi:hypothetical protein E1B28_008790 [Marasmius oreades]|uniref:Ribosomal protein S21 n=1 Tax=Marasmius oreades TaxID=181124 RepID=A0A9P7UUM9_9AGAR|nr:uncharacterized protein E1B28_008790 [Marasmius oreades]KAG7092434.1 hypothetical protein E1B28_008790 [Marasmius oreades]